MEKYFMMGTVESSWEIIWSQVSFIAFLLIQICFHSILPSLATVAFIKLSLGKFADSLRSLSETTPASHAIALKDKYIYP